MWDTWAAQKGNFLAVSDGISGFRHFSFFLYISQWTVYLMPAGMYDNYYSTFSVFLSLHSCPEWEKLPDEKQLRNISGEDHHEHIYVNTVINHFFQLVVTRISDGKNSKVCRT